MPRELVATTEIGKSPDKAFDRGPDIKYIWRAGRPEGTAPYASLTAATSLVSELLASPNKIEHLGL